MGCQSNVCSRPVFSEAVTTPSGVVEAAEALAYSLIDTEELQKFVRQDRAVRLDGDVNRFLRLINGDPELDIPQPAPVEVLEERLEGLPVMREYRQAECAARNVFTAVEETISEAAGFAFIELARSCEST